MGVRDYNPSLGRFSQVDPDFGGSANAYDHVFQNPLVGTDLGGTRGNRRGVSCGSDYWAQWCAFYITNGDTQELVNWFYGVAYAAGAALGIAGLIVWMSGGTGAPLVLRL